MPELPDVEVARQYLDSTSLHRQVERVSLDGSIADDLTAQALGRRLHGARLEATRRHGKVLYVGAGVRGWLRLHFGMERRGRWRSSAVERRAIARTISPAGTADQTVEPAG